MRGELTRFATSLKHRANLTSLFAREVILIFLKKIDKKVLHGDEKYGIKVLDIENY